MKILIASILALLTAGALAQEPVATRAHPVLAPSGGYYGFVVYLFLIKDFYHHNGQVIVNMLFHVLSIEHFMVLCELFSHLGRAPLVHWKVVHWGQMPEHKQTSEFLERFTMWWKNMLLGNMKLPYAPSLMWCLYLPWIFYPVWGTICWIWNKINGICHRQTNLVVSQALQKTWRTYFSRISLGKPPLGAESNYRVTWNTTVNCNCTVVNAVFSTHRLEGTKFFNVQTQIYIYMWTGNNGARNILLRAEQELVFCSALRLSFLTVGSSESPVMQSASVNVEIISIPSNAALTL